MPPSHVARQRSVDALTDQDLQFKAIRLRKRLLEIIAHAGAGHTGGGLSCLDILNVLYNRVLRVSPETFSDPHRDRYVQSKGHSVEALYVTLADRGFFPTQDLDTLGQFQSHYAGHPTRHIPGIEMNTGALGHGLPIGVGMALAAKMDGAPFRVFVLLGDGELAEGSNWEAGLAAAHYDLDNLVAILDHNTLQITGLTRDVMSNEPVEDKWRAFGWNVRPVNGHDYAELTRALTDPPKPGMPTFIIADTVKGKGVGFMENVAKWHHGVPGEAELQQALSELDAAETQLKDARVSAPAPSMFTSAAKGMAETLGLKMGRANVEEFAVTLQELARANPHLIAVTSDSRGSGKLGPFGEEFPQQIVEVGIAEQNLVGITAGLAACGKKSFGASPSCFLTARSLEQIKNDVCYSNVPATLVGISAGVSYGALGSTHHSLHDLAVLRAINNLTIVVPADNFESREAICAAAKSERPFFVRFGKAAMYGLHAPETKFQVGKAIMLREGNDVAFLATGETVVHALLAAGDLASYGLSCRVLSLHTVKPLDIEAVLRAGRECRAVVTVEEHMVHGGLGEACAAVLLQAGLTMPFRIVGIPDEETVTGAQADIFRHYGISMEGLSQTARQLGPKK